MLKLNIQLFASNSNSTTTSSSAGNKGTLAVSFNENSTNVTSNTSNISASCTFTMTSGSFNTSGSTHHLKLYWRDDNENYDRYLGETTTTALSRNNSISVNANFDATHKADGTLNGYVWASWEKQNNNQYVPNSVTVLTGLTTLTTIARATACPEVYATIGNQYIFTVNSASSSFTHYFQAFFGNDSEEGWFSSNNSTIWTPKLTFMNQIPNSQYGEGTIRLHTYSNGTWIGSSDARLILYANEPLAKPDVSLSVYDGNQTTVSLTGNNQKFVKGYSNVVCTPSINLKYGASVSNKSINGVYFTDNAITFNGTGTSVFTLDVTDTRGYGNRTTAGADGNLINYSPLTIKNISLTRTEPTSTTANINLRLNYWNGNFGTSNNHLTGQYRYREASYGEWSEYVQMEFTISDTEATYSTSINNLDWRKSYDFQFVIEDALNTIADSEILPKGIESFSIGDNFIATPHIYLIDENTGNYRQIY